MGLNINNMRNKNNKAKEVAREESFRFTDRLNELLKNPSLRTEENINELEIQKSKDIEELKKKYEWLD